MLPRSKCKLYRFDADSNEWKERGIGQVRLLQHKANKKIRLLMRQEKTLKIRANHIGGGGGQAGIGRSCCRSMAPHCMGVHACGAMRGLLCSHSCVCTQLSAPQFAAHEEQSPPDTQSQTPMLLCVRAPSHAGH